MNAAGTYDVDDIDHLKGFFRVALLLACKNGVFAS
jgi:hypothetical protein